MLKTLGSIESKIQPSEGGVGVSESNTAGRDGNGSKIDDSEFDGNEVRDNEVGKKVQKLPKCKNSSKSKKAIRSDFLTPKARLAFTKLRQVFVKAPIFDHFDLKRHI